MPYITQSDRARLLATDPPCTAGELNYLVTCLLYRYLDDNGASYQQMNDVVGVLESAKHEFQRRIVDPYEAMKMRQNGDVP